MAIETVKDSLLTLLVDDENCIGSSFLLQVIVNNIVLSEMKIDVISAF